MCMFRFISRLRHRAVSRVVFSNMYCFAVVGVRVAYICTTFCARRENFFRGLRTKLQETFGNSNVPRRVFSQIWLNIYLSLKTNMQQPTLTSMGWSGIVTLIIPLLFIV